ncbi:MAG: hypothetical protein WCS94_12570 [Verrucomicrobiota bacterium]
MTVGHFPITVRLTFQEIAISGTFLGAKTMLITSSKRFVQAPFDSESELENVVVQNYEYIFGPSSIYLPKSKITTPDGSATIPDGFAFDVASKQWFIVEAELAKHPVWSHIAPQVAKQITAALKSESKRYLVERIITLVREDESISRKFEEEGIERIDIRKVLDEILTKQPILGMPIDAVSADLREWAATSVKIETKLWIIRKHVDLENPQNIIYELPEEFRPTFDSHEEEVTAVGGGKIRFYDVSIQDLITAGLLLAGSKLSMSYKPKHANEERKTYLTTVQEDGALLADNQSFTSPSYAAIYFINKAGSTRQTVNGWTAWKTESGKLLSELREELMKKPSSTAQ